MEDDAGWEVRFWRCNVDIMGEKQNQDQIQIFFLDNRPLGKQTTRLTDVWLLCCTVSGNSEATEQVMNNPWKMNY